MVNERQLYNALEKTVVASGDTAAVPGTHVVSEVAVTAHHQKTAAVHRDQGRLHQPDCA